MAAASLIVLFNCRIGAVLGKQLWLFRRAAARVSPIERGDRQRYTVAPGLHGLSQR